MTQLKEHIEAAFSDKSLSANQLSSLRALENCQDETIESTKTDIQTKRYNGRFRFAITSIAIVFLLTTSWISYTTLQEQHNRKIYHAIVTEVIENHLKLKPLDFAIGDFSLLTSRFSKIDFSPISVQFLTSQNLQLLGGRYCSIQSVMATQFRYQRLNGDIATLYQAPYSPNKHGNIPNSFYTALSFIERGLSVKIWEQSGLVIVSVTPDTTEPSANGSPRPFVN